MTQVQVQVQAGIEAEEVGGVATHIGRQKEAQAGRGGSEWQGRTVSEKNPQVMACEIEKVRHGDACMVDTYHGTQAC